MLRGGGVLIEYGEDKEAPPVVVRNQELFEPISPDQLRAGDHFDIGLHGRGRDHLGADAAPRGEDA